MSYLTISELIFLGLFIEFASVTILRIISTARMVQNVRLYKYNGSDIHTEVLERKL